MKFLPFKTIRKNKINSYSKPQTSRNFEITFTLHGFSINYFWGILKVFQDEFEW